MYILRLSRKLWVFKIIIIYAIFSYNLYKKLEECDKADDDVYIMHV
jgi:hypothetical protein